MASRELGTLPNTAESRKAEYLALRQPCSHFLQPVQQNSGRRKGKDLHVFVGVDELPEVVFETGITSRSKVRIDNLRSTTVSKISQDLFYFFVETKEQVGIKLMERFSGDTKPELPCFQPIGGHSNIQKAYNTHQSEE